jgi:cytochrome c oxidase assembly factor CtaG
MVQHTLLIGAAPLLLVAGWPAAAAAWTLPAGPRQRLLRSPAVARLGAALAWLARPLPATVLHGAALWVWHAPNLFEAALQNPWLNWLEHFSFFVTAVLFWHGINRAGRSVGAAPAGIAAGFLTMLHGGFLSALITFAPQPLYPWYEGRTAAWGIDALLDQQPTPQRRSHKGARG